MAFNFNKLTTKSQEAIQSATEIASNYSKQLIEPEHLFAALVQNTENIVPSILQKLGMNKDYIQIKVGELLEKLPKVTGSGFGNHGISRDLTQVLEMSAKEAENLKDEYIGQSLFVLPLQYQILALQQNAKPLPCV